ncbi:hypothetical protein KRR39_09780 [Nocardioides panacis]|uniref:Uncharacterized protein n=1 Tax=Nocardioides panacis TaxID=2849501 RepID=A0A975T231_9ACTN|nr:hypothetical protein [Nocardioides panacis]QWZ09987.1 hypothetical protein KRR39_09780 [Nocardioides panacis]
MNGASKWRATWSLVATCGIGLGMLEWGPGVALGCLAAVTVVATAVVLATRSLRGTRAAPDGDPRAVLRPGLAAAAAVVGYWAVARLAPALALLLLTLVLVTSPVAWRLVRRLRGRGPTTGGGAAVRPAGAAPRAVRRPGPRAAAEPPPTPGRTGAPPQAPSSHRPQPRGLDDGTLCRLWRQSFWDLTGESTATGRLEIVAWRQRCLDEIERRDARALHAWLASGARASGGPEKFLRHRSPGTTDAA